MKSRSTQNVLRQCWLVLLLCASSLQAGSNAWFMRLDSDWRVAGSLADKALLISLQGVVNRETPSLYFIYPHDWTYNYTESIFNYLRTQRDFRFIKLNSSREALDALADKARGYVIWDKNVRTSLIVAFTIAGLRDALVVTEDQLDLMKAAKLPRVADLRGRFEGLDDAQIYQWAADRYWAQCSRKAMTWLGGAGVDVMHPGVADYGMAERTFFTDLSVNPADSLERALATELMSEIQPRGSIFGWHAYYKDTEAQHISLMSSFGLRHEGLNSYPNMSFVRHIPLKPGFRFRNNHSVPPDTVYKRENKVYISCIQTDGLGIGAWHRPGRGLIPYAWETTITWLETAPVMLEYFYQQATPNDYFIGALTGPGYMYPKPIPPQKLPAIIAQADSLSRALDLRIFEIMDYSEGNRYIGNIDLPVRIVDAYYRQMPQMIGFVNGYGPAQTFDLRSFVPFISYDYYLSPGKPEAVAVADLEELAKLNSERPYHLLMHVRESSDIRRVKRILDALSPEFEVVPLDKFMRLAASWPTYEPKFPIKE